MEMNKENDREFFLSLDIDFLEFKGQHWSENGIKGMRDEKTKTTQFIATLRGARVGTSMKSKFRKINDLASKKAYEIAQAEVLIQDQYWFVGWDQRNGNSKEPTRRTARR